MIDTDLDSMRLQQELQFSPVAQIMGDGCDDTGDQCADDLAGQAMCDIYLAFRHPYMALSPPPVPREAEWKAACLAKEKEEKVEKVKRIAQRFAGKEMWRERELLSPPPVPRLRKVRICDVTSHRVDLCNAKERKLGGGGCDDWDQFGRICDIMSHRVDLCNAKERKLGLSPPPVPRLRKVPRKGWRQFPETRLEEAERKAQRLAKEKEEMEMRQTLFEIYLTLSQARMEPRKGWRQPRKDWHLEAERKAQRLAKEKEEMEMMKAEWNAEWKAACLAKEKEELEMSSQTHDRITFHEPPAQLPRRPSEEFDSQYPGSLTDQFLLDLADEFDMPLTKSSREQTFMLGRLLGIETSKQDQIMKEPATYVSRTFATLKFWRDTERNVDRSAMSHKLWEALSKLQRTDLQKYFMSEEGQGPGDIQPQCLEFRAKEPLHNNVLRHLADELDKGKEQTRASLEELAQLLDIEYSIRCQIMAEPAPFESRTFTILKVWRDTAWQGNINCERDLCKVLHKLQRPDLVEYIQKEKAQCCGERMLHGIETEVRVLRQRCYWNFEVSQDGANLHVRNFSVRIPADGLDGLTIITVAISHNESDKSTMENGQRVLDPVVYLLPHDLTLKRPVTLTFDYDNQTVPSKTDLHFSETDVDEEPVWRKHQSRPEVVEKANGWSCSISVDHFGLFSLTGR